LKGLLASMLSKVTDIRVVRPFGVFVRFADGSAGTHDFSSLICEGGPMVEPLRDPSYFARVFLEFGALTWPNGFDLCPDWLHMQMQEAGELEVSAAE
jgi:hypothetical protein